VPRGFGVARCELLTSRVHLESVSPSASSLIGSRWPAVWLFGCCALIFAMIVLGGVTRLTESGLSIVDWRPVSGVLPPMSEAAWRQAFVDYQQFPEYLANNYGMDLAAFKRIYWFEYAHRMLGRLIGLVFLIPFIGFLFARVLPRPLILKLWTAFLLGALQGGLGWYMVQSGLVSDPHVSQYRLTAHLLLAMVIYGFLLWLAIDLVTAKAVRVAGARPGWITVRWIAVVVLCTVASGGFVAGTHAGFVYNTFPMMNGEWWPAGILSLTPVWRNFFENVAAIQFVHRALALLAALSIVGFWLRILCCDDDRRTRAAAHILVGALFIQLNLGIATLLLRVPVWLGALHQAGAVMLFSAAIYALYMRSHSD